MLAADLEGLEEITPGSSSVQIRIADNAQPEAMLGCIRSCLVSRDLEGTEHPSRLVEIPIITPVEDQSWGTLKAIYR